ncbi:MAG TPA: hypothetical protein PL001_09305, partial [Candidatus Kryptobacter bacterium]|nr:hypothetical protein [Candidatus Kryptobacter bacterium]
MGIGRRVWRVNGNRCRFLAFLFVVSAIPAVAQVHIRENAVISPAQLKSAEGMGIVTHSLRFV